MIPLLRDKVLESSLYPQTLYSSPTERLAMLIISSKL